MTNTETRVNCGDPAAFAAIVREHQGLVFSLAYRFFGDPTLAEDIAQEVFLDLYKNAGTLESPLHLKMWLRRTATHRCIDEARRRRTRPTALADELSDFPAKAREVDFLLAENLRKYVTALPEQQRAIVLLRYQEDMDLAEIAEALDMPLNTVKSSLHRAVGALRERITRRLHGVRI